MGEGLFLCATAYKQAADLVVEQVEKREARPDLLGYPVLYLYWLYLELMLKSLIRLGWRFGHTRADFPTTHDIKRLWNECRPLLERAIPDGSRQGNDMVGQLITELARIDPGGNGDPFRYLEDKSGTRVLPALPYQQINLSKVRDVMNHAAEFLEASYDCMEELLQHQADMEQGSL